MRTVSSQYCAAWLTRSPISIINIERLLHVRLVKWVTRRSFHQRAHSQASVASHGWEAGEERTRLELMKAHNLRSGGCFRKSRAIGE